MKLNTFIMPILAAATTLGVYALPASSTSELQHECPDFNKGSFDIKYPDLYPSSAGWDTQACVLLVGSQLDPKVIVYDPYNDDVVRVINFDIAPKEDYHISGVHRDHYTGYWFFLVSRYQNEELHPTTELHNNYIIKYDIHKHEKIWTVHLEDMMNRDWPTYKWGRFRGLETDQKGSIYLAATYTYDWDTHNDHARGIIVRIFANAMFPMVWWTGEAKNVSISGLANVHDSNWLLMHGSNGLVGGLDMLPNNAEWEASWLESPYEYPYLKINPDVQSIMLPPKYMMNVMLKTSPTLGVMVTQNFGWKWRKMDWLNDRHSGRHTYGAIPTSAWPGIMAENGYPYETVQIGPNSIFVMFRHKDVLKNGDENVWRFEDITGLVELVLAVKIRPDGTFPGWNNPETYPDADEIVRRKPLPEGWKAQLGPEGKLDIPGGVFLFLPKD